MRQAVLKHLADQRYSGIRISLYNSACVGHQVRELGPLLLDLLQSFAPDKGESVNTLIADPPPGAISSADATALAPESMF